MEFLKFLGKDNVVVLSEYISGGTKALSLKDALTHEPVLIASVNIPGHILPSENHILIKNWGENQGVLEALEDQGWVRSTGVGVPTGFVEATQVELTEKALREAKVFE